jgi:ATP-dependent exoDNAse (exonuclease V) alpha subunit
LIEDGSRPDEIMMLTPFNTREHIGSQPLNARIRYDVLGREGPPVPGDLVYHTQNDENRQVWNGNRGVVRGFRGDALGVMYGNREVLYSANSLTTTFERGPAYHLMWSYAGSVHKAQGSEFKHVIVVIPDGSYGYLFGKSHLYTGCSRAQQSLTIVGDLGAIPDIIEAGRHSRVTALPYLLSGVGAIKEGAEVGGVNWSSKGVEAIKLDEGLE